MSLYPKESFLFQFPGNEHAVRSMKFLSLIVSNYADRKMSRHTCTASSSLTKQIIHEGVTPLLNYGPASRIHVYVGLE